MIESYNENSDTIRTGLGKVFAIQEFGEELPEKIGKGSKFWSLTKFMICEEYLTASGSCWDLEHGFDEDFRWDSV